MQPQQVMPEPALGKWRVHHNQTLFARGKLGKWRGLPLYRSQNRLWKANSVSRTGISQVEIRIGRANGTHGNSKTQRYTGNIITDDQCVTGGRRQWRFVIQQWLTNDNRIGLGLEQFKFLQLNAALFGGQICVREDAILLLRRRLIYFINCWRRLWQISPLRK